MENGRKACTRIHSAVGDNVRVSQLNSCMIDDMWLLCTNTRTYQARPGNFNTTTDIITALESREEIVRHAAARIISRPRAAIAVERDNDDVR